MKLSETRRQDGSIDPRKMEKFISEHGGELGDSGVFTQTVEAMAGKSKEAQEASSRDDCDD